jgi:CRISPR-associated endonuclease/helicase Cas3
MISPHEFNDFFRLLHEKEAFPWQRTLAEQVFSKGWPETLALPTASGKTAVMDIALFHLALQACLPLEERVAPIRIWFVIDRRLVVDEASERAVKIAAQLANRPARLPSDSILRRVAAALAELSGGSPLVATRLRGGTFLDETWLQSPNQPTICVSTVDQAGSRLLFRGYGVSDNSLPIHAGLLGCDSLFILDEAHLSNPFADTLRAVERYRDWADQPLQTPFRLVTMTATPRDPTLAFGLTPEDRNPQKAPDLVKRLCAHKLARLRVTKKLEKEAADVAEKFLHQAEMDVIGVVVNRVASARAIFEELRRRQSFGDSQRDFKVILLTGRIRPLDRDSLLKRWLPFLEAKEQRDKPPRPIIIVATQTIEVGANLSFDALVTEAASLDALRQRFGRLDRLGLRGESQAIIFCRAPLEDSMDPIYGGALNRTWEWLNRMANFSREEPFVDFGVDWLAAKLDSMKPADLSELCTPTEAGPNLLPATLDLWCQTDPRPWTDPDVSYFLHGRNADDSPDVRIVWRADLTEQNEGDWAKLVELMPPASAESIPIPVYAARAWLNQEAVTASEVADAEGYKVPETEQETKKPRYALLWLGSAEKSKVVGARDLRPGQTLVVPSSYSGVDQFGWHGRSGESIKPVEDIAELAFRRQARFRLSGKMLAHWFTTAAHEPPDLTLEVNACFLDTPLFERREAVHALLRRISSTEVFSDEPWWLADLRLRANKLTHTNRLKLDELETSERSEQSLVVTLMDAKLNREMAVGNEAELNASEDASDEGSATLPLEPVLLEDHCKGAASELCVSATRLRLPKALFHALEFAARWHDAGKCDDRFQLWLHGGDELSRRGFDGLLAKSLPGQSSTSWKRARVLAAYPEGYRHEFLSVWMLAQSKPLPDAPACDLAELASYIIGVHHGFGRPLPPVTQRPEGERVEEILHQTRLDASTSYPYARLNGGWPDLFWKLVRRYGWWTLAYLETLLRLADRRRSQQEEQA